MCKQYHYYSDCPTPDCSSVLGFKKRNRYCREALKARRLGHCSADIQVAGIFHIVDSTDCCETCRKQVKTILQDQQQDEDEDHVLKKSSSSSSIIAKPKPQPPSQFHSLPPGQPQPPPKDNKKKPKNGSSKDLFGTVFEAALADQETTFNSAGTGPSNNRNEEA
ncbi:hypothetical protein F4774DRAFT_415073 [Daldinia eschscholtzii]|nr:hypothetical protein F4774DRAFT_415073 [Daldinia eschscholtzii]